MPAAVITSALDGRNSAPNRTSSLHNLPSSSFDVATTGVSVNKIASMFARKSAGALSNGVLTEDTSDGGFASNGSSHHANGFERGRSAQTRNGSGLCTSSSYSSVPSAISGVSSTTATATLFLNHSTAPTIADLKGMDKAKFSSARAVFENLATQKSSPSKQNCSPTSNNVPPLSPGLHSRKRASTPSPPRADANSSTPRATANGASASAPTSARSVSVEQPPLLVRTRAAAYASALAATPAPPIPPKPRQKNAVVESPARPAKPTMNGSAAESKSPAATTAMSPDSLVGIPTQNGTTTPTSSPSKQSTSPFSEATRQFNELVNSIERMSTSVTTPTSAAATSYAVVATGTAVAATTRSGAGSTTNGYKPIYANFLSNNGGNTAQTETSAVNARKISPDTMQVNGFEAGGVPRTTSLSQGLAGSAESVPSTLISNGSCQASPTVLLNSSSRYPRLTQILNNNDASSNGDAQASPSTHASSGSSSSLLAHSAPRPYVSKSSNSSSNRSTASSDGFVISRPSDFLKHNNEEALPPALPPRSGVNGRPPVVYPAPTAGSSPPKSSSVGVAVTVPLLPNATAGNVNGTPSVSGAKYEPYWRSAGYRQTVLKQQFLAGGPGATPPSSAPVSSYLSGLPDAGECNGSTDRPPARKSSTGSSSKASLTPTDEDNLASTSQISIVSSVSSSGSTSWKSMTTSKSSAAPPTPDVPQAAVLRRRPDTLPSSLASNNREPTPPKSTGAVITSRAAAGESSGSINKGVLDSSRGARSSSDKRESTPPVAATVAPSPQQLAEAARRSRSASKEREPGSTASDVEPMTFDEASFLLSPSTRDELLKTKALQQQQQQEESSPSLASSRSDVRALPSRHPLPADVDGKRLSTCSIDTSELDSTGTPTVATTNSTPERTIFPPDASELHWLPDGHFWVEIAGLGEDEELLMAATATSASPLLNYKKPSRVSFSKGPMRVYSTYSGLDYDRRNEDIDPVAASAEYELERRVEKMDKFSVELFKGSDGLGLSIIGMGVGADAGLEKLGIFVKSITPDGAAARDARIQVCDQIVEVDGKSLIGVTQAYAAQVLRSTAGLVRFLIGREKDVESSEIAALIKQSLEQDKVLKTEEQKRLDQQKAQESQSSVRATSGESNVASGSSNGSSPSAGMRTSVSAVSSAKPSAAAASEQVFAPEDETPEAFRSNEPSIDSLMQQLKEPHSVASLLPTIDGDQVQSEMVAANYENVDASSLAPTDELTAPSEEMQMIHEEEIMVDDHVAPSCSSAIDSNLGAQASSESKLKLNNAIQEAFHSSNHSSRAECFLSNSASSRSSSHQFEDASAGMSRLLADSLAEFPPKVTHFPSYGIADGNRIAQQQQSTPPAIPSRSDQSQQPSISNLASVAAPRSRNSVTFLEHELDETKRETEKFQDLLNDSQSQYVDLEKKYYKAKKVIKDYQEREKEMLEREEAHLAKLREKDQEYNMLIKRLKDKIFQLEQQLTEARLEESNGGYNFGRVGGISSPLSPAQDFVPASLAYQPVKKLEADISDLDSPPGSQLDTSHGGPQRDGNTKTSTPIINDVTASRGLRFGAGNSPLMSFRETPPAASASMASTAETSHASSLSEHRVQPVPRRRLHDLGVPATELLDSTVVKSKVEAVKNSNIMSTRQPPSSTVCRRPLAETEVEIRCLHIEHRNHTSPCLASHGTPLNSTHCSSPAGATGSGSSSGFEYSSFQSSSTAHVTTFCSDSSFNGADNSACGSDFTACLNGSGATASSGKQHSSHKGAACGGASAAAGPRDASALSPLAAKKLPLLSPGASFNFLKNKQQRGTDAENAVKFLADLEFTPLQVIEWSCEDVCKFLHNMGLEKYLPEFSVNKVDGSKLLQLDGSKLKSMGVQHQPDRSVLKRKIRDIKAAIERERKVLEKESRTRQKLENRRTGSLILRKK